MTKNLVDKPVLRGTPDRKILAEDSPEGTPVDPPAAVPTGIHCAVCLNMRGERVQADTIVKGYAVCAQDMDLVARPGFDIFQLKTDNKPVV